jgi:hypothetical protein
MLLIVGKTAGPIPVILGGQARTHRHRQQRALSGWTKTCTEPRLCAAIVNRLAFVGQIIEAGTTSYRLAHARAKPSPT